MQVHPRPRLPDRRLHLRRRGHPATPTRPAAARSRCARKADDRGDRKGDTRVDRRHRDPVPGEQGAADRADRRARQREEARGHLRHPRRVRPRRHAHRRRAASADAIAAGRPEQALQADAACSRSFGVIMLAIVDEPAAGADAEATLLRHFIDHRRDVVTRRTLFDLRKAEERAHIARGPRHRARQPRPRHRDHPSSQDPRRPRARLMAEPMPAGLEEFLERAGRRRRRDREAHRGPATSCERQAQAILDMRLAAPHRPRAREDRGRVRGGPAR